MVRMPVFAATAALIALGGAADTSEPDMDAFSMLALSKHASRSRQAPTQLTAVELVARHSLLSGVCLMSSYDNTILRNPLQLKASALEDPNIDSKIMRIADQPSRAGTLQSSSSKSVQVANSLISTYGVSAFESSSVSAGLGADRNLFSLGLNINTDEDSDSSRSQQASETSELQAEGFSYSKTKYQLEPRTQMVLDPELLEPSPIFRGALEDLESGAQTIEDLFRDFGTHVCSNAVLGAWWRITANYRSASKRQAAVMERQVSSAITTNEALYSDGNLAAFGVAVNWSYVSNATDWESSYQTQGSTWSEQTEDYTVDVHHEWKGGLSFLSGAKWRATLEQNKNWRVIDRQLDSCHGIWQWVDSAVLRTRLCGEWKNKFIEEIGLKGGDATSIANGDCTGKADLRSFRKALTRAKSEQTAAELKQAEADCGKLEGFHFQNAVCQQNACSCGTTTGATGKACPQHGAEACRDLQRALCSTMVCPTRYALNPIKAGELCASYACRADDKDLCCVSDLETSNFLLTVRTADSFGCGTDEDVFVKLSGVNSDFKVQATTDWIKLDLSGRNDFETGDEDDYSVSPGWGKLAFIPDKICFKGDSWCLESGGQVAAVTIYNGGKPKGPDSRIADVYGFAEKFEEGIEQCESVQMA